MIIKNWIEYLTEFNINTEELREKYIKTNDINIKAYKEIENKEIFLNNPYINLKEPQSKINNDFNLFLIKEAEDYFEESSSEDLNNIENPDKSDKEDKENKKKEPIT